MAVSIGLQLFLKVGQKLWLMAETIQVSFIRVRNFVQRSFVIGKLGCVVSPGGISISTQDIWKQQQGVMTIPEVESITSRIMLKFDQVRKWGGARVWPESSIA